MIPRFDEVPAVAATTDDGTDLQPPPKRRQELDLSVDPSLLSLDAVLSQPQSAETSSLEARFQQQAAEETISLKTTREKEEWTGSHEGQRIPLFTAAQLDGMNGAQLKNLCDRWGLRSGNRKVTELRARILEEVQLQHKHSAVVIEISDILRHEFKGQAQHALQGLVQPCGHQQSLVLERVRVFQMEQLGWKDAVHAPSCTSAHCVVDSFAQVQVHHLFIIATSF
jgi:hypothetical protein